ncbi:hypothetical protein K435DRAFT_849323 [Dendrothele bispora CBS 962.96]|uniref:Uncharacterized protein n=1 Tax=Dendrothele bispora (strain CBS 962.96) TaxID=1314807 RepID=A0A4S8MT77_DENBC|nr:hypothetical protein K435DRAFT_849323 [Dendrothele bispora CBS 962.96]
MGNSTCKECWNSMQLSCSAIIRSPPDGSTDDEPSASGFVDGRLSQVSANSTSGSVVPYKDSESIYRRLGRCKGLRVQKQEQIISWLEAPEDRCLEIKHEIAVPVTVCSNVCDAYRALASPGCISVSHRNGLLISQLQNDFAAEIVASVNTGLPVVDLDADVERWVECHITLHSIDDNTRLQLVSPRLMDKGSRERNEPKKIREQIVVFTNYTLYAHGRSSLFCISPFVYLVELAFAHSTFRPVKVTSNLMEDSQAPVDQPGTGHTSSEIQGLPDLCNSEVSMNELPQQLQYILDAIERVRNGVESDNNEATSASILKSRLEEVANFAKSTVCWAHGTDIKLRKRVGYAIRWNPDFGEHWETLLEIVEEAEDVIQRCGSWEMVLRCLWIKDDAKALDDCCRNLEDWKEKFLSEARRIYMKNKLDNKRTDRDNEKRTKTMDDTETFKSRIATTTSMSTKLSEEMVNDIRGDQTNHYNCDHSMCMTINGPIVIGERSGPGRDRADSFDHSKQTPI